MNNNLPMQLLATTDLNKLLGNIVTASKDMVVARSESAAQAERIRSMERIRLEEMQANKELFLAGLQATFDERRSNFTRLFDNLDKAMASGESDKVIAVLTSITTLAQSSPFKDLADLPTVTKNLEDADHVWEL